MIRFGCWVWKPGVFQLVLAGTQTQETFIIENAFLFAKLRQFKLLMKICERV